MSTHRFPPFQVNNDANILINSITVKKKLLLFVWGRKGALSGAAILFLGPQDTLIIDDTRYSKQDAVPNFHRLFVMNI